MQIAFGVGCFHFAPRNPQDAPIPLGIYAQRLKEALAALPCVEDPVLVEFDEDEAHTPIDLSEPLPRLQDGDAYPEIPFGRLDFTVTLDQAEQRRLLESRTTSTFTERFGVKIRYAYSAPVAIIECLNASARPVPSSAVKIVREALDEALASVSSFFLVDVLARARSTPTSISPGLQQLASLDIGTSMWKS